MKPRHLIIGKFNRRNFLRTWAVAVGGLIYVPGKYLAQGQPNLTGAFKAGGAFSIGSTAASPVNIITNGLLARWACNEGSGSTLYDSSGNGYNATCQSAPGWVAGHSGGTAVSFASSNYALTGNVSFVSNVTSACTMCAWVYPTAWDSVGGNGNPALSYGEKADINYTVCLGVSSNATGNYLGDLVDGPGSTGNLSTYKPPLNTWSFIGLTVAPFNGGSNGTVYYYFNSASYTPGAGGINSQIVTSPQPFEIAMGYNDSSINGLWTGYLQDVRVYSRTLASSEMFSIYNGTG